MCRAATTEQMKRAEAIVSKEFRKWRNFHSFSKIISKERSQVSVRVRFNQTKKVKGI